MLVYPAFSPFHNVLYPIKYEFHFLSHLNLSPESAFNLDKSKILMFGNSVKVSVAWLWNSYNENQRTDETVRTVVSVITCMYQH